VRANLVPIEFRIDPDALYDEGALILAMDLSSATLARARRTGALRFTRKGHRTFYLGRWLLDWLTGEASAPQEVARA
jgi:hypothetical protein